MTEKSWPIVLWALGIVNLALGAWAAVAPASFTNEIADFGPYNPHLVHDVAFVFLTFGGAMVAAAYVASWRTPVLAMTAVWNGLHAISHLVDIDEAATQRMGVGVAALTVVTAAGYAWLARRSSRSSR